VKVNVIGGGPAGLYLSILLKRVDPHHEITVLERNPADATFGWGVVFSEETLGALRDADHESYMRITDAFATWNTIEIHYNGATIRSRGHAFSAISRKLLLGILQERARELGTDLRFEVDLEDPERAAEADLVVGADGVNSVVRPWRAQAFGSRVTAFPSRFVWFGTDLVFDAFTFIFRTTEHGMFQAHAYPFDAETSTFIVECNEDTWRRAGLEGTSEEETIEFCEELFAPELDGHRLLSNRSVWLSFLNVENESWHDGNVVLLGDAAHTAHFTIGSGTKLAMEDAVSLANAFIRHPGSTEKALTEYEMERQPVVERFQDAARDSARYFENVIRYAGFHPIQFAFNLLTRSGRITYTNLTLRDPHFVRQLDAWFSVTATGAMGGGDGSHAGVNGQRAIAPPPMFAPLRMPGLSVANRVVQAPLGEAAGGDGRPSGEDVSRLVAAAETGAGLVLTGLVAVSLDGRTTPHCPTLHADEQAEAWLPAIEAVHEAGAKLALQLGHAGRRGATRPREEGADISLREGAWPLLSASPIPYTPRSPVPRPLDRDDMDRLRDQFADAAARAAEAGFDALELQLARGYLLHSFISPLSNTREDDYGGSLENRLRYPLEVLAAVRGRWPQDRLLAACVSATDWTRNGGGLEDAVEVARRVREIGCGLVQVVAGQAVPETRAEYRRAFLMPFSDHIRSRAGIPTLVGGYITTPDEINTAVAAGRADLCILDTPQLGLITGAQLETVAEVPA
jgi:anthraniloyl-CoA monooxygenase